MEVPILQSILLHEWCLPSHDIFEAHLLEKHLGQVCSPRVTSVYIHDLVHLVVPLGLLLWAHSESSVDCGGDVTEVPWVDLESLRHVVGNAHEFGEDERALLGPFLCNDELHRCGVHAITERGDESEVSDGQEGIEFVLLDGLVVMVDGNKVQRTILSVDVSNELGNLTLQFWRIRQGGRGNLDENDLSNPLRVVLQQFFEGSQLRAEGVSKSDHKTERYRTDLLNDALDNVELVTADDDFLTLIQSMESIEFGLDSGTENVSRDACRVDTDGAVVHGSNVTLDIDAFLVGGGLVTANTDAGRDEVTLVGIGLEADEVRAEHPVENLPSA